MKKFLLSITLLLSYCISNSQSVFPYEEIKLEKPSDYKSAEPLALSAAAYLLSTPFIEKDKGRLNAMQFLTKWMAGTKEYNFSLGDVAKSIVDESNVFSLYLVAMAKFCIENKTISQNRNIVEAGACKLVLDYCNNPTNNFTLKKKIRKLLERN